MTLVIGIIVVIAVLYILIKIYAKLTCAQCVSKVCLVGKTALITGGSSGIGYQMALEFASRGCKVIIADKNVDEIIKDKLIRETRNPNISLEYVDLISLNSVRELAERLNKSEEKLDILMNNAGVCKGPKEPTVDGLNSTWQINYFSGFLLTHLLVDLLKKSSSGRIIFTSSALSFFNTLSPKDVKDGKIRDNPRFFDYHNSKFVQIVAADIFAEKLRKFNISCNSFHPGVVDTPIIPQTADTIIDQVDHLQVWFLFFVNFLVGKTPEEGAQTGIHLAISKEVEGVTGEFFGEACSTSKPSGATNKQLCEGIWTASEVMVKLTPEEKLCNKLNIIYC